MKRIILLLIVIFISSPLYAEEKKGEEILANVNNVKITVTDFEKEIESLPANYKGMVNANKRKFLDDLILQELLYQEAVKKRLEKDKEIISTLERVKKKILAQKLLEKEVMELVKTSEDEIKKYYEENKKDYEMPEQVNAAHILVRVKDGASEAEDKAALEKAEGLLKKIKEGADFSTVAKENSDCPSSSKGGDLGYFSSGQMVPEFEEAAFKLKVGEVSNIVKTKFGYHIIKVLDKKESRLKELNEVRDEIEQKLTKEKQKSTFENYTEALKAKAKITVNEELLK